VATPKRIGRYEILRELARGGMGVVLLARHAELGREVALKVMRGSAADKGMVQRFIAEAQTVAQLDHPNIVRVHEVGKEGEDPFLVMDLIEGESLEDILKRQGTLPNREVGEIGRALAEALEHAHERSIVHRDVKPANVLIDKENRPLLTDFGLAKDLSAGEGLTQEGQWVGTPGYMPPEQASGDLRRIDRKSDVYGLGGTLYALLTGRPPFETKTAHETLKAIQETRPTPPSSLRPDVSPDLEAVILKCLEKQPEARYLSARELAEDLGRYLHDHPVLARPATRGELVVRWAKRNRAFVAASAAATLLLGLIGVALLGVFVLPQQQAASALSEHLAYRSEVLEPYACGLGKGAAPVAAELEAKLSELETATQGTSREPEARAEAELARATLRVLRKDPSQAVPRATAGRSIPDLVVDTLLLLEQGELRAAKRALASARRRPGPHATLVQLAELELLARADPTSFLEKASGLEGAVQERAVSLRKVAVELLFERQLLAAARGESLSSNDRRRQAASIAAAQRLGMSQDEIAAAKTAATKACAARWRERLSLALERETEARLIGFLGAVLQEEPRADPAPELVAVLDDALRSLVELHQEKVHEPERLHRVIDFDHRLTYEVDWRRRGWRSLYLAANRLMPGSGEGPRILFRYRHGVSWGLSRIRRPATRRALQRLRDTYPQSHLASLWAWNRAQSRARGLEGFEEQLASLEAALGAATMDLAGRYFVAALQELYGEHAGLDPELSKRLSAFSLRLAAWIEENDREDLGSLVKCWRVAERLDPEVPSEQVVERLSKLREAAQDPQDVRSRHLLAIYLVAGMKDHWRLAEPKVALQAGTEALRLFEESPPEPVTQPDRVGAQVHCASFLAAVLRDMDRADEAWQVLQPTRRLHDEALRRARHTRISLYRIVASNTLVEALCEAGYASGRLAAAREILASAAHLSEGTGGAAHYKRLRERLEREHAEREADKESPKDE
jgi:protein kinase-like protein